MISCISPQAFKKALLRGLISLACSSQSVTQLLNAWGDGDHSAGRQFIELVYQDLRCLASSYMREERKGHTLPPTALVHELYLKLFARDPVKWQNRGHFFAVAAKQLRHVIVDYARIQRAQKRGGDQNRIALNEISLSQVCDRPAAVSEQVLQLNHALERLSKLDARAALVVELFYFGGLSHREIGEALDISVATVKRDWGFARVWLLKDMSVTSFLPPAI